MSLIVKDLNAQNIQEYHDRLGKINGFFDFMHEYFELQMDTYRRCSRDKIEELVAETSDRYKREFLRDLRPRGDGRAILRQVSPMTWTTHRYETAFGAIVKRADDYYDLIYIRATQTREINGAALISFALPAVGLAILFPPIGAVAISLVVQKLANDLDQDMPNVVAGFIAAELLNKRMLSIQRDEFYLTL